MRVPSPIRVLFGTALLLAAMLAQAAGQPYDKAKLDAALAAGKPVIVDFAADWCPTCKEQKPIVDALMSEPKRQAIAFFVADFDKETALKKRLKVTMQSTFVVMKGGKEIARSTGQTDKAELAALFDKAL
ncbi:MAG TPA: thioredoxin family protein [Burkholderiaceae bacterium]|nr:thioredoxin family protein [Burkholderiaceae bacterium]